MTTVSAVYLISEQDTDFVIEKTRTILTGIVPRFFADRYQRASIP